MIENFRYISPWNDFEDAIKEMKDVLKKKQAYWAVGFIDEFDLYIDNAAAEKMEKKTLDIIYDEILYLLKWKLEKRKFREDDIRMAISAADDEISEEEEDLLVKAVYNKFELVQDAFEIDRLMARYNLKQNTVSPKLSDLRYDIGAYYMPDGSSVNCAHVNMACKKKLNGTDRENGEITFICDEEDIDFWIGHLEEMKQKIRECKNGDIAKQIK
ncbi:hypothetical protein E5329_06520 [Petralouisia muris]|jgi:hypothetical protein|uniref:Uncharacterized protein n=1 Tax=Petralouisia muris TaxID=3032872 RepID=A0AC61RZ68_9FIRM|nr:hypothetical protein [Petralouisia muris]TGY97100.1 hypothetical protein E5329_06520 [Petralouisia muris]